jgi:hypothetical protein
VIPPNVTHAPCDLDQQRRRHEARRASLARAVAIRNGHLSPLDRLLRLFGRPPRAREIAAEDAHTSVAEDVLHSLRV